uniref:Uncharacterized protein AlNc14C91G5702 n=1 Tax=Albugo laibachii Nc14 TaxID=890382 RepID=F0WGG9_9STRA|nr:conserved hypothetical protein [Albugo laibachii Nc14]|eukprot:CCA20332.1 conserved hypothetical protein [Albugo laibachii Nc14]
MDKALLTRATSKEDAPTPGYIYGEIARMTQHSYDTSIKVMDFMISRVKNKHHTIKYKALQVIKHICREGRADFKREMQRHIPVIKECLQFRGPPDPLKGDEYYRRVREAAKECLDAIYDTDTATGLGSMGISARIQGVGNPVDASNSTGGTRGTKLPWGKQPDNAQSNIGQIPGYPQHRGGYNAPGTSQGYPNENPPAGYNGLSVPDQPYGYPMPYQPEYAHGGNMQYGQPSFGPPPGNERLSGIGNPMYQDARDDKGFLKGLKEKAASKFSKSDNRTSKGAPPGLTNPPDGWSYATNRGPTGGSYAPGGVAPYNPDETYRPGQSGYRPGSAAYPGSYSDSRDSATSQLREKSYDGDRKKGRVGGSWSNNGVEPPPCIPPRLPTRAHASNSQNAPQEYHPGVYKQRHMDPQPALGHTLGAISDGSYERNLISALCAPGGMRAVPPKDKMDAFLKNAITLDPEIIGPILEDCLADGQWTVVSKALTTIEALVKSDGCDEFFEYFADNSTEIENCVQSEKGAIRDRAIRIIKTLGVSEGNEISYSRSQPEPSSSASQSQPQADLLGEFGQASSSTSLFSGLQTAPRNNPEPSSSTENVTNMFGGLAIQTITPSPSTPDPPVLPPANNVAVSLDPLLQPVSNPLPPNAPAFMMNYNPQQMAQMQMAQQMQMQYMQQMHYMQMQGTGIHNPPVNSQVIGAAMTPTGYIAKTIQEPTENADSGFGFIKKKDDSFNFVKDAMKNG